MKTDLKTCSGPETEYMDLSEQLRKELELKIENVYSKTGFAKYKNNRIINFQNTATADFLIDYLVGISARNELLSGKLLRGIKAWFNMYYDDRLSVMDKFRVCYKKETPDNESNTNMDIGVIFCKFLINELVNILAESRWQILLNNAN